MHEINDLATLTREELTKLAGQYINELRASGISRKEIAGTVGLSRVSIWRIQKGMHKTTHFEHGIRIANLHARVFKQQKKANSL